MVLDSVASNNVSFSENHAFYPSALRAGGVLSSRSRRAGGRAAAKLAEPISTMDELRSTENARCTISIR